MVPERLGEKPEGPNIVVEVDQIVGHSPVVHRRQKEGKRGQPFVQLRRLAYLTRDAIENNSQGFSAKVFQEDCRSLVRGRAERAHDVVGVAVQTYPPHVVNRAVLAPHSVDRARRSPGARLAVELADYPVSRLALLVLKDRI